MDLFDDAPIAASAVRKQKAVDVTRLLVEIIDPWAYGYEDQDFPQLDARTVALIRRRRVIAREKAKLCLEAIAKHKKPTYLGRLGGKPIFRRRK